MAEQLAQLALVSKICTELEKHIGMGDKNLAEFVIHLAKESKYDKDKFAKNLESNGAKFPKVLFDSLYSPNLDNTLNKKKFQYYYLNQVLAHLYFLYIAIGLFHVLVVPTFLFY